MGNDSEEERRSQWLEGLCAGLGIALADMLAGGLLRTSWKIHVLTLTLWICVGLVATLFRKWRGGQMGFVLAFAAGLANLSLVSKELGGAPAILLMAAGLSVLAGVACLGRQRDLGAGFLVVASVPLSNLLVNATDRGAFWVLACGALP